MVLTLTAEFTSDFKHEKQWNFTRLLERLTLLDSIEVYQSEELTNIAIEIGGLHHVETPGYGTNGTCIIRLYFDGTYAVEQDHEDIHYDETVSEGLNFFDAVAIVKDVLAEHFEETGRDNVTDFLSGSTEKPPEYAAKRLIA